MKKILIIHSFGLGDFILFTPFIKVIRKRFPSYQIDIFSFERHAIEPVRYCNDIKNFYIADSSYLKSLKIAFHLRDRKYQYSVVTTGPSPLKLSLFSKIINADTIIGEYTKLKIPFYKYQSKRNVHKHFLHNNLKIVKLLIKNSKLINNLKTTFFLKEKIKKLKNNLIGFTVSGGTKSSPRRWNVSNYKFLIIRLSKLENIKIKIFLSIKDKHLLKYFRKIESHNIKIVFTSSIQDTAREISECKYLIGNDNGFMHIASTFGIMLFLIIPKTYNKYNIFNFPYTKDIKIIKISSFNVIKNNEVDTVFKNVVNYLK
jgi:ADP-heptose:LPS heptosyltransferase